MKLIEGITFWMRDFSNESGDGHWFDHNEKKGNFPAKIWFSGKDDAKKI